jgi:hypothetical protein
MIYLPEHQDQAVVLVKQLVLRVKVTTVCLEDYLVKELVLQLWEAMPHSLLEYYQEQQVWELVYNH